MNESYIEHIATRAAEIGDKQIELLCDEVLAGMASCEALNSVIHRTEYHEDFLQGVNTGWRARTP